MSEFVYYYRRRGKRARGFGGGFTGVVDVVDVVDFSFFGESSVVLRRFDDGGVSGVGRCQVTVCLPGGGEEYASSKTVDIGGREGKGCCGWEEGGMI